MKYTTQAEVFEQFARVSKLIEGTELKLIDVFRYANEKPQFEYSYEDSMLGDYYQYTFALALVEGKPVFAGDKLWHIYDNIFYTVNGLHKDSRYLEVIEPNVGSIGINRCAWNQPKKTFTLNGIELPLPTDDNSNVHVEVSYNYTNGSTNTYYPVPSDILKYRWDNMEDRNKVMKAITALLDGVA